MIPQLGPELQHALQGSDHDLEVVDPSTNQHYVIVPKERWLGQTAAEEVAAHDAGASGLDADSVTPWTDDKNRRRAELVDREIAGTLTLDERTELEHLQHEMRVYREKVAPLPLDDTRRLHAELMEKAHRADSGKA